MERANVRKEKIALVGMIVVSVIYGLSFLFTRTAVAVTTPLSLLSWRFTISFVIMTILCIFGIMKINLKGKKIMPLIVLGIFQPVISYLCETIGISLTSASESGLMAATSPVVTMILAAVIIKKNPSKLQTAAIIVAVSGVVGVIMGKASDEFLFNLIGYLILAVNVLAGALFQIFSSKYENYTPAEKTYIMMALGALSFTGAAFVENAIGGTVMEWLALPFKSPQMLISLLYLSICCSIIAFILHNYAIGVIGATRSSAFGGLVTVISVISGVIILGESFTLIQIIGSVFVILGVYAVNYNGEKEIK